MPIKIDFLSIITVSYFMVCCCLEICIEWLIIHFCAIFIMIIDYKMNNNFETWNFPFIKFLDTKIHIHSLQITIASHFEINNAKKSYPEEK